MNINGKSDITRLWISYPWMNREERDFSYLVSQFKESHVEAVYESLPVTPGMRLQERALQRLRSVGINGWLYILTHQCLTRKECTQDLAAAIQTAMHNFGPDFRMAGLLYGITAQHVPVALRIRPCISLADSNWKQQLFENFNFRPNLSKQVPHDSHFTWKIHSCFCGDASMTAVEVHSNDIGIEYWRFGVPKGVRAIAWGYGPTGGLGISRMRYGEASGSGRYENRAIDWFGADNTISSCESAYIVFSGPLPEFICFGSANSPFGPPGKMEGYWTAPARQSFQAITHSVFRN